MRIPREQRRELVASMTEAGMSTRAIRSALGVAAQTVRSDQAQVGDFAHLKDRQSGGEKSPPAPEVRDTAAEFASFVGSLDTELDDVVDAEIVDDDRPRRGEGVRAGQDPWW